MKDDKMIDNPPAKQPTWKTEILGYFVAVLCTCMVFLSIFLPLLLRSDSPDNNNNSENPNDNQPVHSAVLGDTFYTYNQVRSELANMNALFFSQTGTFTYLPEYALSMQPFVSVENRNKTLGFRIFDLPIIINGDMAFDVGFRVLCKNARFAGIADYQFLPSHFYIDQTATRVSFSFGTATCGGYVASFARVHFIYGEFAYYIQIFEMPELSGEVTKEIIKIVVNNLFAN